MLSYTSLITMELLSGNHWESIVKLCEKGATVDIVTESGEKVEFPLLLLCLHSDVIAGIASSSEEGDNLAIIVTEVEVEDLKLLLQFCLNPSSSYSCGNKTNISAKLLGIQIKQSHSFLVKQEKGHEYKAVEEDNDETQKDVEKQGLISSSKSTKEIKEDIMTCKYCQRPFNSQKWLNKHLVVIHSELHCEECNFTTLDLQNMNEHNKKEHRAAQSKLLDASESGNPQPENIDEVKKYSGTKAKPLRVGLDEKSNKQTYYTGDKYFFEKHEINCNFCEMQFSSERWMKKHIESIHLLKSKQKCAICEFSTFDMFDLYEHNSTVHINIKYDCNECEMQFTNERYMNAHKKREHTDERAFICATCCASFRKKKHLKNHEEKVHSTLKVVCPKCSKLFNHKDNLKTHMKYHDDGQQLKCEHCGKGFVSSQKLGDHINLHTGEKPFKCKSTNCGAAFGSSSSLSHHKKACPASE